MPISVDDSKVLGGAYEMPWCFPPEIKTEPQDTQSTSDGFHSAASSPNRPSSLESNENISSTMFNTQNFNQAALIGLNFRGQSAQTQNAGFDPIYLAQMLDFQRLINNQFYNYQFMSQQNQNYATNINFPQQRTGAPQMNGPIEYQRSMYPTPNTCGTSIMSDTSRISETPRTSKTTTSQHHLANTQALVTLPTSALHSVNLSPSTQIAEITPPKSPGPSLMESKALEGSDASSQCGSEKSNNGSETQCIKSFEMKQESENVSDVYTKPAYNAHGKAKTFTCRVCGFTVNIKVQFWAHVKLHMKEEKILQCKTCPFVTEYKHHMEYHNRQHTGEKPYKCERCEYKCVNKSMLLSHFKSHSNIYQYSCMDCDHVAKYCHSMKLHCQRLKHRPAMVLNEDGSVNPNPIIDVYGRRRGPKPKKNPKVIIMEQRDPDTLPTYTITAPVVAPVISFMGQSSTPKSTAPLQIPKPTTLLQKMEQIEFDNLSAQLDVQVNAAAAPVSIKTEKLYPSLPDNKITSESNEVLDLSVKDKEKENNLPITIPQVKSPTEPKRHRRKGPVFKIAVNTEEEDLMTGTADNERISDSFSPMEVVESVSKSDCVCNVCGISFLDKVLYDHHQSYHSVRDPLTCNMCGESYSDARTFNVHLIRVRH